MRRASWPVELRRGAFWAAVSGMAVVAFVLVAPGRWFFLPDGVEPVLNTVRTATRLTVAGAVLLVSRSGRTPASALPASSPLT